MRTIISTVGKSLWGNFCRTQKKDQPTEQELANYLRHEDEKKASAETNALSRLIKQDDRLVFLHSATDEGRKCARILAGYYENKGFTALEEEITDLDYQESKFKMKGLRFLVEKLISLIKQERNNRREVLINATGGFKAEIAYATMLGLLMKVPVYYIHEVFNDIIEMPPSPIDWDYSFIADFEDFFSWLDADLRPTKKVEKRLNRIQNRLKSRSKVGRKRSIRDLRMLLSEEEGYTMLSPTGRSYFQSYREFVSGASKSTLLFSEQAHKQFAKMDPDQKEKFKQVFQKLSIRKLWPSGAAQKKGDCLVYPQGHVDERVFFTDDNEKDRIYILELTRHSDDSYEKKLNSGGVWTENYGDFDEISPQMIWG